LFISCKSIIQDIIIYFIHLCGLSENVMILLCGFVRKCVDFVHWHDRPVAYSVSVYLGVGTLKDVDAAFEMLHLSSDFEGCWCRIWGALKWSVQIMLVLRVGFFHRSVRQGIYTWLGSRYNCTKGNLAGKMQFEHTASFAAREIKKKAFIFCRDCVKGADNCISNYPTISPSLGHTSTHWHADTCTHKRTSPIIYIIQFLLLILY
jgi:hypothetical protein